MNPTQGSSNVDIKIPPGTVVAGEPSWAPVGALFLTGVETEKGMFAAPNMSGGPWIYVTMTGHRIQPHCGCGRIHEPREEILHLFFDLQGASDLQNFFDQVGPKLRAVLDPKWKAEVEKLADRLGRLF